jgi:hypothetical protein
LETNPVPQSPPIYNKVVAFIPTGWANGSNWNKKNAICTKDVVIVGRGGIQQRTLQVEVRLISYSEHSSFSELQSFVEYLKPRMMIPTVFSDEANSRRIVARFHNLLDQTKAQKAFFRTMIGKSDTASDCHNDCMSSPSKTTCNYDKDSACNRHIQEENELGEGKSNKDEGSDHDDDDDDEDVVVITNVRMGVSDNTSQRGPVSILMEMGFPERDARECLLHCHDDLPTAIDTLLGCSWGGPATSRSPGNDGSVDEANPRTKGAIESTTDCIRKHNRSYEGCKKVSQITDFFHDKRQRK